MNDTIFALSSGAVPAGVAVVRLSGPAAGTVLEAWCGRLPQPRRASLATLTIPGKAEILDRGLVLWMPGPGTFTGEDVAELHLHGSRAVLSRLFECLGQHPGTRAAERGEFTRRAFDNGRLYLPEVEGLADLIEAETEVQRRQAIRLAGGDLGRKCEAWRAQLIRFRAQAEAQLDFSDEGDVGELAPAFWVEVARLRSEIRSLLDRAAAGERVRLGYRVALVGPPNAGKSTLLNAIAGRDVAIVTDEAGTTRDVLEVPLDLGGYPVLLYDTAGLRDAESAAEQEGIRRARLTAEMADLVLWLREPADTSDAGPPAGPAVIWRIATKSDLGGAADGADYRVSARTGEGTGELLHAIQQQAMSAMLTDGGLVTRERHAAALRSAEATLAAARGGGVPLEITADLLRSASDAIGRVSGRVDVEDVLDSLFREFCIGK